MSPMEQRQPIHDHFKSPLILCTPRTLRVTLPPASRQMRATALSRAKPLPFRSLCVSGCLLDEFWQCKRRDPQVPSLAKVGLPQIGHDPLEILNYSPRQGVQQGGIRDDSGTLPSSVRFVRDQQLFCKMAERLAADVLPSIVEAIKMRRMTALRKTNGATW